MGLQDQSESVRLSPGHETSLPATSQLRFSFPIRRPVIIELTHDYSSSKFLNSFAPQLAYANPFVPFHVERIPDPRTKALDPNAPGKKASWPEGSIPSPELQVDYGMSDLPFSTLLHHFIPIDPVARDYICFYVLKTQPDNILASEQAGKFDLSGLSADKILERILQVAGPDRRRGIAAGSQAEDGGTAGDQEGGKLGDEGRDSAGIPDSGSAEAEGMAGQSAREEIEGVEENGGEKKREEGA